MKFWAIVLTTSLLLAGCSTPSREVITTVTNQCPALKKYSREQMLQAANELKQLPTESQLAVLLTDYSKLRDACRVAERKLKELNR